MFLFLLFWASVVLVLSALAAYWRAPESLNEVWAGGIVLAGTLGVIGIGASTIGSLLYMSGSANQPSLAVQKQFLWYRLRAPKYLYAETGYLGMATFWVSNTANAEKAWHGLTAYVVVKGPGGALMVHTVHYRHHKNVYRLARDCLLEGNIGDTCSAFQHYSRSGYPMGPLLPPVADKVFRLFGCHPALLQAPASACKH